MPRSTPPDGFAVFVAERSTSLLRSAWLLTGDAARAEDLLQTALTAAWRHWARIDDPTAYVRRVLVTTYLSWSRRRWRGEYPAAAPPELAAVGDLAAESATRDAVRRALARLSAQQRAVVVLRFVDDRSVADTAEILGCSAATVKVQSARALSNLRSDPHLRPIELEAQS